MDPASTEVVVSEVVETSTPAAPTKALDTIEKIQEYLEALTEFDDDETHEEFLERVEAEITKIFSAIDALPQTGQLALLKGKVLNDLKEEYDPNCEAFLKEATSLLPANVDAWILLGEVRWKNQDYTGAKDSFETAIKNSEIALRQLSMALRNIPSEDEYDPEKNLNLAIIKAKEAIAVDFADGDSWYFLGNAHLTHFLHGASQYTLKELEVAMMAFKQAEKTIFGVNKMDMYHNKAVIHRYLEQYQDAFTSYSLALAQDPEFEDPKKAMDEMIDMLASIKDAVFEKKANNLPAKKRNQMLTSLPQVGSTKDNLSVIGVRELQAGADHSGKCIAGKIVSFISNPPGIPVSVNNQKRLL